MLMFMLIAHILAYQASVINPALHTTNVLPRQTRTDTIAEMRMPLVSDTTAATMCINATEDPHEEWLAEAQAGNEPEHNRANETQIVFKQTKLAQPQTPSPSPCARCLGGCLLNTRCKTNFVLPSDGQRLCKWHRGIWCFSNTPSTAPPQNSLVGAMLKLVVSTPTPTPLPTPAPTAPTVAPTVSPSATPTATPTRVPVQGFLCVRSPFNLSQDADFLLNKTNLHEESQPVAFQLKVGVSSNVVSPSISGHRPFATAILPNDPLVRYSSRERVNEYIRTTTWPKESVRLQRGRQLFIDDYLLKDSALPTGLVRTWHTAKWRKDLSLSSITRCVTYSEADTLSPVEKRWIYKFPAAGGEGATIMKRRTTAEGECVCLMPLPGLVRVVTGGYTWV